ncbi:hypothetical protein [Pragia fontium]|uniref:hypothetical protein n=1 Tax=Pragia fontium TaxID=82985 RepID=UPI00064AA6B2|nr:hypothetical protein [Pragia fontium]AKJ41520.1 hypothetical protein QQ39_05020 [Pragia fontium]
MLNKRERKFIHPAVVYGWKIENQCWNGKTFWEGDNLCPVNVGPICEGLVKNGYMEKVVHDGRLIFIRATSKAAALKCYRCQYGKEINDDGDEIGTCTHCDGEGMKLEDKAGV